jgi:hypothetical protein
MTVYAKQTTVSPEKSRGEIERILTRYGAQKFMYGWQGGSAIIAFESSGRRIRFVLPLPIAIERGPKGRKVRNTQEATERETRQRWRALALCIKAKLEAVSSNIASFEDEFLPYTVLPNGMTVGEYIQPQIERAYETQTMPPLLGSGRD